MKQNYENSFSTDFLPDILATYSITKGFSNFRSKREKLHFLYRPLACVCTNLASHSSLLSKFREFETFITFFLSCQICCSSPKISNMICIFIFNSKTLRISCLQREISSVRFRACHPVHKLTVNTQRLSLSFKYKKYKTKRKKLHVRPKFQISLESLEDE